MGRKRRQSLIRGNQNTPLGCTAQNEMFSDPLNILNQNILKPRTSALYFSFLGVEKGGRGAAQNNNFQRRKIPTTRADTCFLYSPPNRVQSSQTALSEKASAGSEMGVTRKKTRRRGVAEA